MPIPIVVFWTEYKATARGSVVKVVPCESCSAEYVYLLEREGVGADTSVYLMNGDAEKHAVEAATDTLDSVLENDFDPVPCPVCGHYQRYMFSRLMETKGVMPFICLLVLVLGCLAAVGALYRSVTYLQHPNDYTFGRMIVTWSVLTLLCLVGFGLSHARQSAIRRFDPNREDQQARIARGQSLAITRAEFEARQINHGPAGGAGAPPV